MKKIYAFFAAALMSVSLFAQPTSVPTAEALAAKYDVAKNVVLCCYFDVAPCNPVVVAGSYNGWSDDPTKCIVFEALLDFEGWYVAEFEWSDGVAAKPLQLNEGTFDSWDYQSGDKDAWIHKDGKEVKLSDGYAGEANVEYPEAGAYIYEIAYWKNHGTPCKEIKKHNYTIILFPPYCEKHDDLFTPAISGAFNSWGFTALNPVIYQGDDAYGITFESAEGKEFKLLEKTFGWDNEYLHLVGASWEKHANSKCPEATQDTTLVFDYSDNDSNCYAMCGVDIYTVNFEVSLPAGAPAEGVELMGSFIEGESWNAPVAMELKDGKYTAQVRGIEASEFKFRGKGSWDNQILVFDEGEWKEPALNWQFGEEWEAVDENTKAILLDLSDPEEYKWKIEGGQGIENIELTEKAQKVVVDGVIYIIRDNKMFNVHGAQVR